MPNVSNLLNAIRGTASERYTNNVPVAVDGDLQIFHSIGTQLTENPTFANEFLDALYNRIAYARLVAMDAYKNPLADFKKKLEFGESYVEYAVRLVKAKNRNYTYAKSHFMDIELPELASAIFHINYEQHYDITVTPLELKKAFLSFENFEEFINYTVENLFRSMEYDEFLAMKYVIVKAISNGELETHEIPAVTNANSREIVTRIKTVSNNMRFLNKKYTQAEIESISPIENQYIFVTTDFEARITTEVLATSYNLTKAEFNARMRLIDGLGELDTDRLDALFANDPNYETPSDAELALWNTIPCVILDKDWFVALDEGTMIYNQVNQMGPYNNYSLHVTRTLCHSPFFKGCAFTVGAQSVTSVAVTPETATGVKGDVMTFKAAVVTVNFADPRVIFTVDDEDLAEVVRLDGQTCYVKLLDDLGDDTVTVTATSVFDNTKTDTATISAPTP